jgi:hypothetical protein
MVGVGIGLGIKLGSALKALLAAGAVVAVVSILTWERIKRSFDTWNERHKSTEDLAGFSFLEALRGGKFRSVYGVFNRSTEQIVEAETVTAESIDETLRHHHENEPFVVYR